MRSPLIRNPHFCSFWKAFGIWWKIILNWWGSFGAEQNWWFDIWGNVPLYQHIKHSPNLPFVPSLTSDALSKVSYLKSDNTFLDFVLNQKKYTSIELQNNVWSVALITLVIKQHKSQKTNMSAHQKEAWHWTCCPLDDMMMNRRTLLNAHNDAIINRYNGLLGRKHITVFGHIVGHRMDYCQKILILCVFFCRCS